MQSSYFGRDVLDIESGCHLESVRAESKLTLVHKHGYILRFYLHQERGRDRGPEFPLALTCTQRSPNTHRISGHSAVSPTSMASEFPFGGKGNKGANGEKLHRACSGGETEGEKDTAPLELHTYST